MNAADFIQAVPDLTPILQGDDDARQNVLLSLWERRESIQNMPHYARRAARYAAIDSSKRTRLEGERAEHWNPRHDSVLESASPLDRMIEAEDVCRLRVAVLRLPQGQRDACLYEMDQAPASSEANVIYPRRSHRSNLFKAKRRLRALLVEEGTPAGGAL